MNSTTNESEFRLEMADFSFSVLIYEKCSETVPIRTKCVQF